MSKIMTRWGVPAPEPPSENENRTRSFTMRVPDAAIEASERENLRIDAARLRYLIRHPAVTAVLHVKKQADRIPFIDEQMRKNP